LSYFHQFLNQWQTQLKHEMAVFGLDYRVVDENEYSEVQTNTLRYLKYRRSVLPHFIAVKEERDNVAWLMLEKQLHAFADKADRGVPRLTSKLHMNEEQIIIRLNFCYDPDQHIIYVS